MKLKVNGGTVEIKAGLTVAGLLRDRGVSGKGTLVELNRRILGADRWDKTALKDNDALEILSFVTGG